jgi:hypothetical protein
MKTRFILCTLSTLFSVQFLFAQDSGRLAPVTDTAYGKNAWYFEFGGASIIGATLNYDRMLSKKRSGFSIRAGAGGGFFAFLKGVDAFGAIPFGVAYTFPCKPGTKDLFEVAATNTYFFSNGAGDNLLSPSLSWKHVTKPKGLQFKATFIPVFYAPADQLAAGPWFGFSIGKRF